MIRINRPISTRLALGLLAFFLVAAACGGETATEPPASAQDTSSTAPSTTTTTTTAPPSTTTPTAARTTTTTTAPPREYQPTLVSYRYPADDEVQYAMSIVQESEVTLEGGPPEAEMPPGPIVTATTMEGTISYLTSAGPEEGTTTIRILTDLELTENQMSMGGITLPTPEDADIPGVPGLTTSIDITVVVDAQGNVMEVSSEALGEFSDLLGDGDLFPTEAIGNQQLNRPFGPVFPDQPLEVGDSWSETLEQEGPGGAGTIVTTAEHRLVEVDTSGQNDILVVESQYHTDAFELDMSQLLQDMFGAFGDLTGGEQDETSENGQEDLPEFTMLISATPSTTTAVTRFDSAAGLALEGNYQTVGGVTTNMTLPDDNGDMAPFISITNYNQTVTYRLISPAA